MQSTAQKRVFNNYSVGFISFLISFGQAIVTVPILLNYWGNDVYGIWIALFAGFSLLQTFDFGHQSYIGNLLNIEYHINKQKFADYVGSSLLMAFLLGLLQLSITIFLILSGYLNNFLGITSNIINYSTVSISLISLMLMWVLAGSIGGILVKILIPAGYMSQSLIWGIIFKLAQFLSLIIVAITGGFILEASIVYSIVQILLSLLVFRYLKNKMPEFYPWWKSHSLKTGFHNLKKSVILTINNLLQQLSNNGLVLFITNIFSTSVVPAFTTVRTLTNSATIFTNLFITSIQPDLIKYHAKGETEKLQTTLNANWFFSGLVVNTGLILIIPFAETIFRIWTKGIINFDFILFLSLAASISVINFGAGLNNYLYGINKLRSIMIISIARIIILAIFSFYLSRVLGLAGIGVAVLLSEISSSIILPFYFGNKILNKLEGQLSLKASLTALLPPLILLSLLLLELYKLKFNYFIWALALFLTFFVYIFNWSILDKEIKIRFKDLFSNLFGNSR
jgi:O-antigen/teichoic acid export membrane protein